MTDGGVLDWFYRLRDLVIPDECGACGGKPPPGRPLCRPCADVLAESAPTARDLSGLPVLAAGGYGGVLKNCLLAYKERGRRDLAAPLARLMAERLRRSLDQCTIPVVLVPVPSTRLARRARGFDHLRELTSRLSRLLPEATWLAALSVTPRPDSAGLDRARRRMVAAASMRCVERRVGGLRRALQRCGSLRVVLVDDIVTSGATLDAAGAALNRAGVYVNGAVTAASAESDPI